MSSQLRARGSPRRVPKLLPFIIVALLSFAAIVLLASCGRVERSSTSGGQAPVAAPTGPVSTSGDTSENPGSKPKQAPSVRITETTPGAGGVGDKPAEPGRGSGDSQTLTLELRQGSIDSGKIALTFDAGASSKPTPALLAALAEKGVRATFFLTGKWVEKNPELTRQISAAGHEIGNHTYSHRDLRKLTDEQIREELAKTEDLVQAAAGTTTRPYFRPPYGGFDSRVPQVAAEAGYRCVYWTADSWDGFKKGIEASEIEQRVLDRAQGGAIVLMHCGSWPTVQAVPRIVDELRARGCELVTISDLAQGKR